MPIPTDYQEIISTLADKTDAGLVHWQSDRFTTISVTFDSSRFKLWSGNDEHTNEPFIAFALQTEDGQPLDSWYVEEGEGEPCTRMHLFLRAATRYVRGVPATLKRLREKMALAESIGDSTDALGELSKKLDV